VKTIGIEQATLDACVRDAQVERVVITQNGAPVALIVGLAGMDEEQVQLGSSDEFWKLIAERRRQKSLTRAALEEEIDRRGGAE
jgi:antitoxin (DNA-binding transcriptional repressor) of toxin-antitoxin stability system